MQKESPDVFALQETKSIDENFPTDAIKEQGYHVSFIGQKTYNGVATISKFPIETISTSLPNYNDKQRRVLAINTADITVLNIYVPNGSEVNSEKYKYKLEWFSKLHPFVNDLKKQNDRLIILGDFNIAPEDRDVHAPEEWKGCVLVSKSERDEFEKLLLHELTDCFRMFNQEKGHFSWWDYRAASFRRNRGVRIDHILASNNISKSCQACYIDKNPRRLIRPSDHTPVVAEFDM
jgi:exodeoxyribonuclease-3